LEDLRSNYGEYLCSLTVSPETIDVLGEFPDVSGATAGVDLYHLYTFPTPTDLVNKSSEQLLREIGMGYRAK
jgi:3-methyladenine DNA glycosylase/8-oxoguanine DNA glycosylase